MFKKRKKYIPIIILSLLMAFCFQTSVFAYEPATVSVPVSTNEPMTIYVETDDGTPYRLYHIDGTKKIRLSFDEPGTYGYYITQIADGAKDDTTYDEHKWYVRVTVESTDADTLQPYFLISDVDTKNKVNQVYFTNTHGKIPVIPDVDVPEIPTEPRTPDAHVPDSSVIEQIVTIIVPNVEIKTRVVERLKDLFEEFDDLDTPLASFNAKTGDTGNTTPYVIMMIASAGVFAMALFIERRKRRAADDQ